MHSVAVLSLFSALGTAAAAPGWGPHPGWGQRPGSQESIRNMKDHIKNVVVLVMENRSFDNLLGGQKTAGLDNPVNNGPFCNPLNLTRPELGEVCTEALDYDSILNDPDHAVHGNNIEFYGTFNPDNEAIASGQLKPNQKGFVHEQLRLYSTEQNTSVLAKQVMNYYTEEQVPTITALVKNFVTFNNWHSDVPGVSTIRPFVLPSMH